MAAASVSSSNRSRARSRARQADRHELYESAVQDPQSEVRFVARSFRKLRGREARNLREDFCGTGVFSLAWAQSHNERRAWGVDLDEPTLQWGLERRILPAGEVASRVELIHGDVLGTPSDEPMDVVVAFNFSYWIFETRASLLRYFKVARDHLVRDGVLYLDAYGGTEIPQPDINRRTIRDFVYVWEQKRFNVLDHHMDCAIHFEFKDGSVLRDAFEYSWRMWSLPELREHLLEAGFREVRVFWERTDAEGEGTGRFFEPKHAENQACWWTYIAAER